MIDRKGQQLGNYCLDRFLGKGGSAEVYLGQHVHLHIMAAVKVLQTRLIERDFDAFRTEAQTIASLKHPHIVRILEFGVEDGTPFLVMDYAPKGTLRQCYPRGTKLPIDTVIHYVKQIAAALQYAHDKKLIHRDVKPENLLKGENEEIVLSDFGLASVVPDTSSMQTGVYAGTISYSAPEQILGKPRRESDQYSLGIIVYEWLSGDRPFRGTVPEIISQHIGAPPRPLHEKVPDIPPKVEEVVMKALSKEPKNRFESVQAFADALEQAYLASIRPKRSDLVGQQFDNYRLTRLLSVGPTSFVYLGEHLQLGTTVAIKIPQEYINIEEFQNRVRLNVRLVHPHIVRILNVSMKDQMPFVVMDFASHGTLRDRHPRGSRHPLSTVVSYTKQLASALQYAHDQNLLHGNIHPGTMLVGDNDEIFLISFYSVFADRTQEPFSIGPYTAPERLTDKLIPASDQYALGVAIYEWLCGDYHLNRTSSEDPYKQILQTPPTSLREKNPEISAAVEAVVMKALAKDPKHRFGSVQEFADRFEQACMPPQIRPSPWSDFWLRASLQMQNALTIVSTKMLRASRITWHALVASSIQILGTGRITWNELAKILAGTRISRRKVLAGLGLMGLAIAGGWLLFSLTSPKYLHKKSITIHHKNVPSTLSNFPVLISLTDTDLKTATNGGNVQNSKGYDIIFTDSTETITLDHEIEKYVPTTGELVMWVRIPTLSARSDNVIYMHYGNSSVSSSRENKTGVWDSNYKGVWHLSNGSALTTNDSTSNGNNGTNHGASAAAGQIGGAASFNSSSQYIQISNTINLKQFSISAWFKTSDGQQTSWRAIVSKNSGDSNRNFWLGLSGSNSANYCDYGSLLILYSVGGTIDAGHACTDSRMDDNNWHFATATYDGTTLKLYVDGSLSNTLSVSSPDTQSQATYIGIEKESGSGNPFTGILDEIRISNIARSADWIATEYHNQSSPSTFYNVHPAPILTPTSTPLPIGKPLLYLFVRGTENKIWVDHFDGSSWSGESLVNRFFQTPSAPSVAQYGNMFYLFARGNDNGIYFSTTSNGSTWSGLNPVPPGDGRTYDAPKATTYGNTLYMFNRGNNDRIYFSTLNGSTWSNGSLVNDSFQTPSAPSAAQYGNILYLFARGNNDRIYFSITSNGSTWSGLNEVPDNGSTHDAPTATTYGNTLYVFVRATDDSVFIKTLNGSTWSGWSRVPGGFRTPSAPSVAQYGNTLYLFARSNNDNGIYVNTTSDGSSWKGWSRIPGNGLTSDAPGAATYGVH